jgi:NAD(P)-dependent dehydrogenase (short-subunit alcohol dehydrogenase family)/acyl carrier protein
MPAAAPPVPAVLAAAPAPPAVAPAAGAIDFTPPLVEVAAERTGYAPEMLDLDLSIEADLGIDSIKRVEILSAVRRACSEADQQKLQSAMDALTRLKTLREIARAMTDAVGSAAAPAPAPAAGPVPPPAAVAPAPVATAGEQLLQIVAERTGYPLDMLGLDLNIEADLGIDSIKRVEILASFRRQRSAADQARLQAVMDRLTGLKTLRELSRVIEETIAATPAAAARAEAPAAVAAPATPAAAPAAPQSQALTRVVFAVADAPPLVHALSARGSIGLTLVTDDGGGVAAAVCARLRAAGERAVLLRQRGGPIELSPGELFADWTKAAEAERALARLRQTGSIAAVLHLAPLAPAPSLDALTMGQWRQRVHADLRQLHLLVRWSSADLRAAGRARGAAILAATALGGDFGQGGRVDRPTHGGVVGYMRTAAIEFPEVRTRIVDFDAAEPVERAADRIAAELDSDGPLEIGYSGSTRVTLAASLAPLQPAGAVPITSQSVVLLTGGARGITAELAIELARRFRPTLVLAGLSPVPADVEDGGTAGLDGSALKSALAAQLARGQATVRPVEVERAFQRVVRGREIRRTLATCEAAGARVEYRQADVRDEASLASLLDEVYTRHGRIDVLVHGAGIIEDKLIEDKTPESFDRVVHTKADSLFTLVRRLRTDAPPVLVLMSSVTAAFGNRGQADYGAANGVYNAMAQMLSARRGGRAVAMNWGPWDKLGMASEEVRRQFLARGITPIDPAAGVQAVLAELASGAQADAVVVLGDGPWARGADAERAVEMLA